MGNPSLGIKVQTTMSLSKGRHRQTLSAASLQLEKPTHQERWNAAEKESGALGPRATEEMTIAAFLGDKKTTRRTRSSLGGSEDFMKGLELNEVALVTEEKKPNSYSPIRGHRRVGSGNTTPLKLSESPRARGIITPSGKEKYAVAKFAASLFHSPAKLERSMSLSRVAHRAIPDVEGTRCPPSINIGEVILPCQSDKVLEIKEQNSLNRPHTAAVPTIEGDVGKERSLELSAEDEGGIVSSEQDDALPYTNMGNPESLTTITSSQNAICTSEYLQSKGTLETMVTNKDSLHLPMNSLDLSPIQGDVVRDAAEPTAASLRRSTSGISPHDFMNVSKSSANKLDITSKLVTDQSCLQSQLGACQNAEREESASTTHNAISLVPNPSVLGRETSYVPDNEEQPCAIIETTSLPPGELSTQEPMHLNKETIVPPAAAPQDISAEDKDVMQEKLSRHKSQPPLFPPEKVTEEELTEAAFLSSLVCEGNSSGPMLISEDSLHFPSISSKGDDIGVLHLSMMREAHTQTRIADATLRKSTSFEPGLGDNSKIEAESRSIFRKRRRSISASGIGAMLLKVVRVSESGPIVMRKLPKVGPEVCGVDPIRAREYVIQKTAQIDVGLTDSHTSLPPALHQNDLNIEVKLMETELDSTAGCSAFVGSETDALHNADEKGCENLEAGTTGESQISYQQDSPEELSEEKTAHIQDIATVNSNSADTTETSSPILEERISDGQETGLDPELDQKLSSFPDGNNGQGSSQTISTFAPAKASVPMAGYRVAVENGRGGRPRKKQGHKRRDSYDLDNSARWQSKILNSTYSNNGLLQAPTTVHVNNKQALSLLDENVVITRQKPRSFVSMLQGPPLDDYRLPPSSIAMLSNPSFSSSHQDRLWEEQAEAYSSGGRGTPGREDDTATNVFHHYPSPGGAISSDDQSYPASDSLRKGHSSLTVGSVFGAGGENGQSSDKNGKKRVRPRTPLRNLLAEDVQSSGSGREGSHFLQQIMSRIRRSSSKLSSPKSPASKQRRRYTLWSSCICFSHAK